jgi:hypothetical protein
VSAQRRFFRPLATLTRREPHSLSHNPQPTAHNPANDADLRLVRHFRPILTNNPLAMSSLSLCPHKREILGLVRHPPACTSAPTPESADVRPWPAQHTFRDRRYPTARTEREARCTRALTQPRSCRPSSAILRFVLLEARRPTVSSRQVPGSSGSAAERGSRGFSAETGGGGYAIPVGGQAKSCPLSSGVRGRGIRASPDSSVPLVRQRRMGRPARGPGGALREARRRNSRGTRSFHPPSAR